MTGIDFGIGDAGLPPGRLPAGIRSRRIERVNGLSMHVLESGFEVPGRAAVLLLHGFPELAYSWRDVMLPLAAAGLHVIAPDRRGYGLTTGWAQGYDVDLEPFGVLNGVRDMLSLVWTLGLERVEAVVGHDFGSPLAAWAALIRPDVFRSVVLMSAPFEGPPPAGDDGTAPLDLLDQQLAALPRPRKYYMRYYTTREANADLQFAPQGLHDFMRAYFHFKSADWKGNRPAPLASRTAAVLATLPTYYVMDRDAGMADSVAPAMPTAAQTAVCRWMTEDDLGVFTAAYAQSGFQGGLNEYRCLYDQKQIAALRLFSGRAIDVPSMFIGGRSDWGVYQSPGALEVMSRHVCRKFAGIRLVDDAGHWVQQEQPAAVTDLLLSFLQRRPGGHKR